MAIVKWAVVGVTLLMGLANLGQVGQDIAAAWKVLGIVLATAAVVAVVGLVARKDWGTAAVITVCSVNLLAAIGGAIVGVDGWPVGLVLAALGIVLGAVYRPTSPSGVAA